MKDMVQGRITYLIRVHLKLANHLDGDFGILVLGVLCSVHVAEGPISHLFHQMPPFETRVLGHLPLAIALLGDKALDNLGVIVLLVDSYCLALVELLLITLGLCGDVSGPCSSILIVNSGR